MIEQLTPCLDKFSKETLLGRLEVAKVNLKKSGDFPKIEIAFNAMNIRPILSRRARTSGNFVGNNKTKSEENMKIDEAIALLVKR